MNAIDLGATLYVPSTRPDLAHTLVAGRIPDLRSAVVCLEDAVAPHEVETGLRHLADPTGFDPSIDTVVDAFCGGELKGLVPKAALLADLATLKPDLLGPDAQRSTISGVLAAIEAGLVPIMQAIADAFAPANAAQDANPVAPAVPAPTDVARLPTAAPTPFATVAEPVEQCFWPVITDHPQAMLVSYRNTGNQTVGSEFRRFFADRRNGARHHVGMDVYCRENDVVVALQAGRIVAFYPFYRTSTGEQSFALLIEHEGVVVNYGEVRHDAREEFHWGVGDSVAAGQHIARVSSTAMIHFETYLPGTRQNSRWLRGDPMPPSLLNPTILLLTLAARANRIGKDGIVAPAHNVPLGHLPVATPGTSADVLTLARTIYGEARNQSTMGREAVGHVVLNRSKLSSYSPVVSTVCMQPRQFSCWNAEDPNRAVISGIMPGANRVFDACFEVAQAALQGRSADVAGGATHYYATYIRAPDWTVNATLTATIGVHRFFSHVKGTGTPRN